KTKHTLDRIAQLEREREEFQSSREAAESQLRETLSNMESERRRVEEDRDAAKKSLSAAQQEREAVRRRLSEEKAALARKKAEFDTERRSIELKTEEERTSLQVERAHVAAKLAALSDLESTLSARLARISSAEHQTTELFASQRAELRVKLDEASRESAKAQIDRLEAEKDRRKVQEEAEVVRRMRESLDRESAVVETKSQEALKNRQKAEELHRSAEMLQAKYHRLLADLDEARGRLNEQSKTLAKDQIQVWKSHREQGQKRSRRRLTMSVTTSPKPLCSPNRVLPANTGYAGMVGLSSEQHFSSLPSEDHGGFFEEQAHINIPEATLEDLANAELERNCFRSRREAIGSNFGVKELIDSVAEVKKVRSTK
ncbi:hypothetical protein HDU93_002684, partial [Gonapodya sp. JEL0774]